jgi:endo-1,4-beta-xylanase
VAAELHIYAGIGHGFGVRKSNPAPVSGWTLLSLDWMNEQGLLKKQSSGL